MVPKFILITSALATLFAIVAESEPIFGGANVCNKTITVRRDKGVEEPTKYELQYAGICGIIPCTKTRVETKMDFKVKTTWEEMDVAVCCPGYAEAPDRKCLPICLKSCNHGNCVAPNQCKCHPEPTKTSPGFTGSHCDRFACLVSDRWGTKCDRECNCPPNSYCSASTGKCICRTGWRGTNCTEECDSSMNCEDVELPPIIEPDSNIILDSTIQSQKLEALAPKALLREFEDQNSPSSYTGYNMNAFNVSMNLVLMTLVGFLIFAIWRLKNRLMNDEIYYTTRSAQSSNYASNSYYSNGSNATSVQNRPRMPTPLEAGLYGKNLNFDAATRYILLKDDNLSTNKPLDNIRADSKVEVHLMTSQESSKQNLYSDIDQSLNNVSNQISNSSFEKSVLSPQMLCITTPSIDSSSHYQVPKSPANRNITQTSSNDEEQQTSGIYENSDLNLYEEIKPRSPHN